MNRLNPLTGIGAEAYRVGVVWLHWKKMFRPTVLMGDIGDLASAGRFRRTKTMAPVLNARMRGLVIMILQLGRSISCN
jgi:hypothetical protein